MKTFTAMLSLLILYIMCVFLDGVIEYMIGFSLMKFIGMRPQ